MRNEEATWAVVGGGLSGVATAWFLRRAGLSVEVIEKEPHLGGRVGPGRLDGLPVDFGGKNIGKSYRLFREWVAAHGDPPFRHFGLNSTSADHAGQGTLDSRSRMRGLRDALRGIAPGDLAQFVALAALVRVSRAEGDIGGPVLRRLADRFDDAPASAYFGEAFAERVLRPMVVRMNGAEADEVFIGNLGTNLRLLFDDYEQLDGSMADVFERFGETSAVSLSTQVDGLWLEGGRIRGLELVGPAGRERREYAGVVLALPAKAAATLLAPHDGELASVLDRIRYFPVATVIAAYDRPIFGEDVRAFRFGPRHALSNAGVYSKETPQLVRYTFSGAAARDRLYSLRDPLDLLPEGERTLGSVRRVEPSWRVSASGMAWKHGLCAYGPHHERTRARVRRGSSRVADLHLTGDYLRGVSIEACFRSARDCAEKILADLPQKNRTHQRPRRVTRAENQEANS